MIIDGFGTAATAYDFFCFNSEGKVLKGSIYVDWVAADFVQYRVPAVETYGPGSFIANVPNTVARYDMRLRASTLAASSLVGSGTPPVYLASLPGGSAGIILPPPETNEHTVAYSFIRDSEGAIVVGANVNLRLETPGVSKSIWDRTIFTLTSDSDGRITRSLLKNSKYGIAFRDNNWKSFTTLDAESFEIPDILGPYN